MRYEMRPGDALGFARATGLETREDGDELQFKYCPYCRGGPHRDQFTFALNTRSGAFKCLRSSCGHQGHFVELCKDFGYQLDENPQQRQEPFRAVEKRYKELPQVRPESSPEAIEFMRGRAIPEAITRRYNVTTRNDNHRIIVFPFYDENGVLTFAKYRRADFDPARHKNKEWCEKNTKPILFGMYQCSDYGRLVITEGQIDSMSVAAAGIENAVSVPTGAAGFKWFDECKNWVLRFKEIVVFGDCEGGGVTLVKKLRQRIPESIIFRCVRMEDYHGLKDANDILRQLGPEAVRRCVENAAIYSEAGPIFKPSLTDVNVAGAESNEITYTSRGTPELTINNFYVIMRRDDQYQGVRFNDWSQRAEIHVVDAENRLAIRAWDDSDDARSMRYFERRYGMYAPMKHDAAMRILLSERRYNPLIEIVEGMHWDGESRCEYFLTRWLHAEDSPYTREVSRLIFAGGINRLYEPGCKFDAVPVLIGRRQGEGKSALIQWLALHDDYSAATKNMSGDQKSVEAIQGAWIVEIPELAAFRTTDIESLKAFCTKTFDKYRQPYERHTTIFPRRCIFIGSTNNRQFLTDKTGNRRFFPVEVFSNGNDVFRHKEDIHDYILQCWAEAKVRYQRGEMKPVADPQLADVYREKQAEAMEDDWRVGVIEEYLSHKVYGQLVCVKELFHSALFKHDENRQPTAKDSREIGEIMDGLDGWERCEKPRYTPDYGKQRCWSCNREGSAEDLEQIFN